MLNPNLEIVLSQINNCIEKCEELFSSAQEINKNKEAKNLFSQKAEYYLPEIIYTLSSLSEEISSVN